MLLEKCLVSRKTPLDGKLEVSERVAGHIAQLGPAFSVSALSREATGTIETLACTCDKRPGGGHVHHFLTSPLLKDLVEGAEVRVELDKTRAQVRVVPTTTGRDP